MSDRDTIAHPLMNSKYIANNIAKKCAWKPRDCANIPELLPFTHKLYHNPNVFSPPTRRKNHSKSPIRTHPLRHPTQKRDTKARHTHIRDPCCKYWLKSVVDVRMHVVRLEDAGHKTIVRFNVKLRVYTAHLSTIFEDCKPIMYVNHL